MAAKDARHDGRASASPGRWPVDAGRRRVVVIGGGFAGLEAVKALRGAPVEVTLVDRENHHLFQPLTYQVATGALAPDEVAEPLRTIFRRDRNVRVLMAEATGFDPGRGTVLLRPGAGEDAEPRELPYDTLVVAGGSTYSYFGHDEWRPHVLEVKSLQSALAVRARLLAAFEAAEIDADMDAPGALTFLVVGGGPTGVEMAGQIAELAHDTLAGDFRAIDPATARVLLVETGERILPAFPPSLSARATAALQRLGVTVLTGHTVVGIAPAAVEVRAPDGATDRVATAAVVWAAGVTASPLARLLADSAGTELDRAGRVTVEPDLTLAGHPTVLALGDMVRVRDARTGTVTALPGLAPVAMQQGRHAGRLIRDRLDGRPTPPFRYRDKGNLATIGRASAVADLRRVRVSGLPAWILWLAVHLVYLIGFENRAVVLMRWSYTFFTHGRGGRLITRTAGVDAQARTPSWRGTQDRRTRT
jgi:NADH:ubiquinone reductase (H+-translocating)